jgi:hypothetical protein
MTNAQMHNVIPPFRKTARPFLIVLSVVVTVVIGLTGCAGKGAKPEAKAGTNAPSAQAVESASPAAKALDDLITKAAAQPMGAVEGTGWKPMFDGKTMAGWAPTDFSGHGGAYCQSGLIILEMGNSLTGVNWTNEAPKVDYEIALETMKLQGSDFFCGLTFPVADSYCTLILGGWGGTVVGLSSIEGQDASENETTQFTKFETGQWYRVRVRVTKKKIAVWLDDKQIVNLETGTRNIGLRFGEIEMSKPLGIASYETTAALRGIKIRRLEN